MMRMSLVLAVLLAACGGEDDSLIGTWMNADGVRVTYHEGGALEYGEGGQGSTGRWSVEGDRLFIERNTNWAPMHDTQFTVDGDRLVTDVMRREGPGNDVVGIWIGTAHGFGATDSWEEFTFRLTVYPDGTGRWGEEGGTWERTDALLEMDLPSGDRTFVIAEGAIGRNSFDRVAD